MNTSLWILALAVAGHVAIGMVWYSPNLFGMQWAELMGWTPSEWKEKKKGMTKVYVWSTLMAFVIAYILASFITLVRMTAVDEAAQLGFWMWFGFVMPTSFINVLFAGTSKKLWAINVGYHLASLVTMSVIIVLLK